MVFSTPGVVLLRFQAVRIAHNGRLGSLAKLYLYLILRPFCAIGNRFVYAMRLIIDTVLIIYLLVSCFLFQLVGRFHQLRVDLILRLR